MSKFIDREAGAEDNARWDSDDDFEPPATPDGGWETVENVHVAGGADQVAATVGPMLAEASEGEGGFRMQRKMAMGEAEAEEEDVVR